MTSDHTSEVFLPNSEYTSEEAGRLTSELTTASTPTAKPLPGLPSPAASDATSESASNTGLDSPPMEDVDEDEGAASDPASSPENVSDDSGSENAVSEDSASEDSDSENSCDCSDCPGCQFMEALVGSLDVADDIFNLLCDTLDEMQERKEAATSEEETNQVALQIYQAGVTIINMVTEYDRRIWTLKNDSDNIFKNKDLSPEAKKAEVLSNYVPKIKCILSEMETKLQNFEDLLDDIVEGAAFGGDGDMAPPA